MNRDINPKLQRSNYLLNKFLLLLTVLISFQESCGTHARPPEIPKVEAERAIPPSVPTEPAPEIAKSPLPIRPLKEELPESVLTPPERDSASPQLQYDTVVLTRSAEPPLNAGWQYRLNRQKQIVGFEFSNRGGNTILPNRYNINKNLLFTRDFQFRFEDRARQDIYLELTDWAPSRDKQFRLSELMSSVMHFFPRNNLPAIVNLAGRIVVTLPTGEEVEFDAQSHEVLGGVFSEAPVDLNPDKTTRKFPAVAYTGKGILVRANSRGTDPRISTTALITTGSPAANCERGAGCDRCAVPSKELWDQKGAVRFKFPTDEEFGRYLLVRCGFTLPTIGFDFLAAPPLK